MGSGCCHEHSHFLSKAHVIETSRTDQLKAVTKKKPILIDSSITGAEQQVFFIFCIKLPK